MCAKLMLQLNLSAAIISDYFEFVTVAILAQGTSRAVAATQAFSFIIAVTDVYLFTIVAVNGLLKSRFGVKH